MAGLLDYLPSEGHVTLGALAKAISGRDTTQPRWAVKEHLDTAVTFGLVREEQGRVLLNYRGACVREGGKAREAAIRGAFASDPSLRPVAEALLRDTPLECGKAERRLVACAAEGSVAHWYSWLQAGGLAMKTDTGWIAAGEHMSPLLDAFDPLILAQADREVYLRMVRLCRGGAKEAADASTALGGRYDALRATVGNDAAPLMLSLLEEAFGLLGFETQRVNGEREHRAKSAQRVSLDFGETGDDFAAVFLRAPLLWADSRQGWVLAVEAKAGAAQKLAVTQALAFAGRVQEAWGDRFRVLPIVISGRETYVDRNAKTYARDTRVVHVPLDGVIKLGQSQWRLYGEGKRLITPPMLLSFLEYSHELPYTEPTSDELVKTVCEISDRGTAAFLASRED